MEEAFEDNIRVCEKCGNARWNVIKLTDNKNYKVLCSKCGYVIFEIPKE